MTVAPPGVRFAVVICAYTERRWDHLQRAVRALQVQSRRPDQIVVVIDHNDALLGRAERELGITVLANRGGRGLAAARNTGIAHVDADVVAFLDDDAEPEQRWLERLAAAYEDDAVLGAGGDIRPRWEGGARPAWFPHEFDWVVGCTYRGMPTERAEVRNLIGANMSVRRDVLERVGGFSESLGRVGADTAGTEETDLCIRASREIPDGTWLHIPQARVDHHVPVERASVRYFVRRCLGEGRSKAAMTDSVGAQRALASELAYTLRTLPAGALEHVAAAARARRPRTAARSGAIVLGLAATTWGYVRGRLAGSIARNSTALMTTTVLNLVLGFAFWAIAARAFTASEVGTASAVISAMTLVSLISGLGAGPALVARLPGRGAGAEWSASVSASLALAAAGGVVAGAAAIVVLPAVFPALATLRHGGLAPASFVAGTALWSMTTALDYVFIAERASRLMTLRNLAFGATKIPLIALPAWAASAPADRLLGAWVVAAAASFVLGIGLLVSRLRRDFRPSIGGLLSETRAMGRMLAGNHAVTVGNALPVMLLPVLVADRLSPAQSAYFYVTWMVGGVFFMISSSVGSAVFAEVSHDAGRVRTHVVRGATMTTALLVPAMLVLSFGGSLVLGLFGPEYADRGGPLLLALVVAAVPDAVTNLAVAALRVTGRLAAAARLTIAMAAATVAGSWLLLPGMGLLGPGVAFLAAQSAGGAWVLWDARRCTQAGRRPPRTRPVAEAVTR